MDGRNAGQDARRLHLGEGQTARVPCALTLWRRPKRIGLDDNRRSPGAASLNVLLTDSPLVPAALGGMALERDSCRSTLLGSPSRSAGLLRCWRFLRRSDPAHLSTRWCS